MRNFLIKKLGCVFLILNSLIILAQSVPPPPENPESGDIGGYPASPIDDYTIFLFIVAVLMIVLVTVKAKQITLKD